MDAGALLHPRGPLEPGVYWRRRAITLVVAVLAILLLARACGGGDAPDRLGADGDTSPSPSPSASKSAATSASAKPSVAATSAAPSRSPGGPCAATDLRVVATTNKATYSGGERPVLQLEVRNIGPVACVRDLGQAARELRVTSGNDRIWSSDDCAPGGDADVVTLAPGKAEVSTVTWSGTRSRPGCEGDEERATAGTYRVNGRVGELRESGEPFVLR